MCAGRSSTGRIFAIAVAFLTWVTGVAAQTTIPLPLTTGSANKLDLGFFAGGTQLQLTLSGLGDLVDSRYQTNPDGSLAAVAGSPYGYAEAGAAYGSVGGFPAGDGINHYVGGGANYDFGGGSAWPFAGLQSTDTTDPLTIRHGAVVATFVSGATRNDWFEIGYGRTFVVPGGGANLYVAVNESFSPDNHGSYSLTYGAIPEPAIASLGAGLVATAFAAHRRRRWSVERV